jgi:hypothetical protein
MRPASNGASLRSLPLAPQCADRKYLMVRSGSTIDRSAKAFFILRNAGGIHSRAPTEMQAARLR